MKRIIASLLILASAAPAFGQGLVISESLKTQKMPTLSEARDCATVTGYWIVVRRTAKQSSKSYEAALNAWSAFIQQQTGDPEAKVQSEIMTAVEARAKQRDQSWVQDRMITCAAFERVPAPPAIPGATIPR